MNIEILNYCPLAEFNVFMGMMQAKTEFSSVPYELCLEVAEVYQGIPNLNVCQNM